MGRRPMSEGWMGYVLGIDLGTTYSAAAVGDGDRFETFQLGDRAATIPSVVLLRADGEVLTGESAEHRALSEPTRVAREFKRRLGDPVPLILGGTPYGAEALIGHLLRAIVDKVASQMGEPPSAIALTHPASYGPYKLDLLRLAVRQADAGDVSFISEPEAAALHYASQERVPTGEIIAVYDFGGGTFDATVLRKTETGFEQLGVPEGLERLGGIDFDEAVLAHVDGALGGVLDSVDPADSRARGALSRTRDEARRAKEALSLDTDATISVYLPSAQGDVRLTREEFETMIRPRISETIAALGRAVRSAGLSYNDLGRILLVGGTSRIPLVAEMVASETGRPVAVDAHPKHTTSLGAARAASAQSMPESSGQPMATALVAGPAGTVTRLADGAKMPDPRTSPPEVGSATAEQSLDAPSSPGQPPWAASEVADSASPPPPPAANGGRGRVDSGDGGRGRSMPRLLLLGVPAMAVLLIAGGFLALSLPGSGPDATATPFAGGGASPSPDQVTISPTTSATPFPTATRVVATPSPTIAPSPSGTASTPAQLALITGITIDGNRYAVDFETHGFTPELPGRHVHFFFDTVAPDQAGVPGSGPWYLYGGPSPFRGYRLSDRPTQARQMCILIARANHSVLQETGNCWALP